MYILGTKYKIVRCSIEEMKDYDGLCNTYTKQISIRHPQDMLGETDTDESKAIRYMEVLRHEITHAFLFESGMECYCDNELIVDWIAKQFPKMLEVFEETKSIFCSELFQIKDR